MIRAISIALLAGLLLFSSCGDNSKTAKPETKDSVAVPVAPELSAINKELEKKPNDPDLYFKRAKYYLAAKSFDAGLTDIHRAMNIDSSKTEYYLTLSDLYFATNQSGDAKNTLEKCIALDPKNVDALLKLAELYLYVRKSDKSIEYINQALRIDKYNAKAYFMKGMNFKDLKDTSKAISSMQTAVEQDQQYYDAYMQLGILTAAINNKLAIDYYKNAIRIQPKSAEAWYGLGKFYQDIGDWDNATGTYITLLKMQNNENAFYNLGVINLLEKKEYNQALEYFTGAININPKYTEAYYGRGLCYQALGDMHKASVEFQSCLSLNPEYAPAKAALAKAK